MADTITVKFKVLEDGSLSAIGTKAEKAAAGLSKAGKASDNYSKKQKGVAHAGMNSTKAFSKMTIGINDGLVPAYAALAANVFALSALFGVLSRNDAIAKLEEGLEFTGRAAGRNLGLVADKLKEITDGAISAEQAMRTTAVGISAGFSEEQMAGLAEVAKGAALALGRDMGDAMDRLTRGAAKLEPEILDELGIMVRLDDAVNDYALAHNKATSELTQFERRQAFTNAIIEDGSKKFKELSEALDPSAYSQLSAAFADLSKSFIGGLNLILTPIMSFLASTPIALGALAASFGASISGQIVGGLVGLAEAAKDNAKHMSDMVGVSLQGVTAHQKLGKAFNEVANGATRTEADLNRMMKSLNMTINMTSKDIVKLNIAKTVRNELTKEIHLQTLAQVQQTHSNALVTMQTHGLTAAIKIQVQAFKELGAAHTAAMATSTGFARAQTIARTAATGLAMSIRFLGAAFLRLMPQIAAVLTAFSLISPLYNRFFKDNSKLGKALEDNTERLDEFSNVATQYADSIDDAEDATEKWIKTLKPISGLLTEAATALDSVFRAAQADRIIKLAQATAKYGKAVENVKKFSGGQVNPGIGGLASFIPSIQAMFAGKDMEESKVLTKETLQLFRATAAETSSAVESALTSMKTSLGEETEENKDALAVVTKAIETVKTAFVDFAGAPAEQTEEAFKTLTQKIKDASDSANSAVNAFETFGETVTALKEVLGDPTATFGVVAKEIDSVREALNKIQNISEKGLSQDTADKKANEILALFGLPAGGQKVLEGLEKELISINDGLKTVATNRAKNEVASSSELSFLTQSTSLLEQEIDLTKRLQNTKIVGTEAYYNLQLKLLNLQKELNDEEIKLGETVAERRQRQGGDIAGSIAGAGESFHDFQQQNPDASTTERFAKLNELSQPMLENMRKLGPEGEFVSAVTEGAFVMAETFTMAFDDIEGGGSKMQVGLEVASAGINVLANMMATQSKARISAIDDEIAAEKKRDGKSESSLAKIKQLEKKKEDIKRKAFEKDKKMKMAQVLTSTGAAIMKEAEKGIPAALPGIAFFTAMGAAQLAAIAATKYSGGGSVSDAGAPPTDITVGQRSNTVDLARGNNQMGEIAYMRGAQGIGGATNFRPAFMGYKNRAAGGYIVGEQGPELFMPEVPGEIIPSGQGMGQNITANFNIQALDASGVEEILLQQQNHIIGMIRSAANDHGEFFLESVDTGVSY